MFRIFNISAFLLAAASLFLWLRQPDRYFALIQEDTALEWMTFWAFGIAAIVYFTASYRRLPQGIRNSWFALGMSAGCLLIALEEISWGQRIFHFRPPGELLARNIQGEANLHNLASPSTLFWGFVTLVVIYGIILSLCARQPKLLGIMCKIGVSPPPASLMPSYLLIVGLCVLLPAGVSNLSSAPYGNEGVELLCGFVFLASALSMTDSGTLTFPRSVPLFGLVIVLGFTTAPVLSNVRTSDPALVCQALDEMEAMRRDFYHELASLPPSPGLDLRVSTFVGYGNAAKLRNGAFADRAKSGLMDQARSIYFLDPWNQSYWVSDRYLHSGKRVMFCTRTGLIPAAIFQLAAKVVMTLA